MKLDALHLVFKNKIASEKAIESFRAFYEDSDYILIGDDGDDYYDIAKKYNCVYLHSPYKCGYPQTPHGFLKEQMEQYLKRIFVASTMCSGTHIIVMEDDVHVVNKIQVKEENKMLVGEECMYNTIHPVVINFLQQLSNNHIDNFYGMGGGTIFHKKTFIESYNKFYDILMQNFDDIQKIYPTIGWTDCILSVIMMLGGAKHEILKDRYELSGHGQDHSKINYSLVDELKTKYSILHHYKKYY
jgi:hypothetical protein